MMVHALVLDLLGRDFTNGGGASGGVLGRGKGTQNLCGKICVVIKEGKRLGLRPFYIEYV